MGQGIISGVTYDKFQAGDKVVLEGACLFVMHRRHLETGIPTHRELVSTLKLPHEERAWEPRWRRVK